MNSFSTILIDEHNKPIDENSIWYPENRKWRENHEYFKFNWKGEKVELDVPDNEINLIPEFNKSDYFVTYRDGIESVNGYVYGRFGAKKEEGKYVVSDLYSGMSLNNAIGFGKISNLEHLKRFFKELQDIFGHDNIVYGGYETLDSIIAYSENNKKVIKQLIEETR